MNEKTILISPTVDMARQYMRIRDLDPRNYLVVIGTRDGIQRLRGQGLRRSVILLGDPLDYRAFIWDELQGMLRLSLAEVTELSADEAIGREPGPEPDDDDLLPEMDTELKPSPEETTDRFRMRAHP